MRVGIFADSYLPYVSGVVRSIETFREELEKRGVIFFLFVPWYPGCQKEPNIYRFWALPAPTNPDFTLPLPFSPRLGSTLRSLKLDLIHVHGPFLMGSLGARWARRLNLPLVFTYHTLYEAYVHYFPFLRSWARTLTRRYTVGFCNRCDLVLAPSLAIKKYLEQNGVKAPVEVLPTGIKLSSFRGGDREAFRLNFNLSLEEKVLVYVGRLGEEKNLRFLLRSFALVKKELEATRLVLVGGGPQKEELEKLARSLGVGQEVIFTGPLPPDKVKDAYAAADLFVIASLTETQGLVVGEAKAAGLPVVGVEANGVKEMVRHGLDGFLTPPDEKAFAAAVIRLLSDEELYRKFKQEALKGAEELSSERQAERLLQLYRQLVAGRDKMHEKDGSKA
ncbi:glycosyl transferase group 1 [Ammonifex degensii KC4]|uniref:Glycosyl transferase group 1 n=1 Tax=Ammonifex degensii (strain DSM 10501 / KC4) TaxID=429009 RepID=C9RD38_AMMDK|nr:glycosyltransferase family 4 protein [Ammonifex degensii]ACX52165.1 glycosyl transferase group 1 [Ammonifex degensii KC4]